MLSISLQFVRDSINGRMSAVIAKQEHI